jgi:hypothetical protein
LTTFLSCLLWKVIVLQILAINLRLLPSGGNIEKNSSGGNPYEFSMASPRMVSVKEL